MRIRTTNTDSVENPAGRWIHFNEFLDMIERSGFRRASQTVLPTNTEDPVSPTIGQVLDNPQILKDIARLGTTANQWLAGGCVESAEYQSLSVRLGALAQEYGNIRQLLLRIQARRLAEAEKVEV